MDVQTKLARSKYWSIEPGPNCLHKKNDKRYCSQAASIILLMQVTISAPGL